MSGKRIFIRLPQEEQFGPYICPEEVDVVQYARKALRSDSPWPSDRQAKLAGCDLWVQLPEIPEDYENKYVLLLVSAEGEKQHTEYVYVVWMKEETISLDEVRGFVCNVYGPSAFDKESLRFCEDTAKNEDQSPPERVYINGSVFKAVCTHHRKTIEAPKDQPILSPSEESSSSQASSSSTAREVSQTPQHLLVTAAESDRGQKSHPLVFNEHTEDKTSLATDQPIPATCTMHESKEERKAMNDGTTKSVLVAPQLNSQKEGIFVVVPTHTPGHLPGAHVKQYSEKDEDSTTYTSSQDKFTYGMEEEKTDEANTKPVKTDRVSEEEKNTIKELSATGVNCEDNSSSVQSKVLYFEKYFQQVTPERLTSSVGLEGGTSVLGIRHGRVRWLLRAYEEHNITSESTRNGDMHHYDDLDASCRVPSTPDVRLTRTNIHAPQLCTLHSPHPDMPQNVDPCRLTDGQQVVAQATDCDSPNPKNTVYLKSPKQLQEADSSATDSVKQLPDEATNEQCLENGCFPSDDAYRKLSDNGKPLDLGLIYCSQTLTELTGLRFGSCIAHLFEEMRYLGRGGNGRVFQWSFRSSHQKFAFKHTDYRPQELKIWSQLNHENVVSLHGVVLLYRSPRVYQLMPSMTGSFQEEIKKFGTLHSLVCSQNSVNEPVEIVLRNTYYIYREMAAGLSYLHQKGLVHGDVKASNVLISKPPTCCCLNTLLCTCQYSVLISDFDSTSLGNNTSHLVKNRIVILHPGTLFYRSPEAHSNNRGPWCDVWSVGCSLIHLIVGRSSAEEKRKTYGIGKRPTDIYSDNPLLILLVETCDAREQLVHLLDNLCDKYPEFKQLVKVIVDCLNLDYRQRITAPIVHEKFSTLLQ